MSQIDTRAKQALTKASSPGTMSGMKSNDIESLFRKYRGAIAQAIPKHLTADRMIQFLTTMVSRSPELKKCTVESIIGASMQATMLGFRPITNLGECYFVPYKNRKTGKTEAQFIIGYKGYVSLARRSGQIKTIYGYAVYSNDTFEYELGLEPKLKHIPAVGDRGELIMSYAVAHFKDGGYAFEVCNKSHIAIAKKKSTAANSEYSPWKTNPESMWVKTAIRRLSKWLPLSIDEQTAILTDESTLRVDSFKNGEVDPNKIEFDEADIDMTPDEPEEEQGEEEAPAPEVKKPSKKKKKHTVKDMVDLACKVWECDAPQAVSSLNEKANRLYGLSTIDDMEPMQIQEAIDKLNNNDWIVPF